MLLCPGHQWLCHTIAVRTTVVRQPLPLLEEENHEDMAGMA
jgi:hypothetical protein